MGAGGPAQVEGARSVGVVLLVQDIMNCKPGKVRPMMEKFIAMSKLGEKKGLSPKWPPTNSGHEQRLLEPVRPER